MSFPLQTTTRLARGQNSGDYVTTRIADVDEDQMQESNAGLFFPAIRKSARSTCRNQCGADAVW
jgi:hypothetical protein